MLDIILGILSGIFFAGFLIMLFLFLKKKPVEVDIEQRIKNQQEVLLKIEALKAEIANEITNANLKNQLEIQKELNTLKESVTTKVTENVNAINDKVETRLKEGFKTSEELYRSITTRLAVIDSTQKNIEKLATNVDELSSLLSDKKTRGIFGEGQLNLILNNVFGEGNTSSFELQKTLSNNNIVDAILHGPSGVGDIAIDSKFPLENYLLMYNDQASSDERAKAEKDFKLNIKKHIDDISGKYIIKGETADQAIMFIPAEAIFAEIHAKYPDLINYAQEKRVWLTSPTTLVYMATMIYVIASNVEREKSAKKMLDEIEKLLTDFRRFNERFLNIKRNIQTLTKSTDEAEISLNKVNNKVAKIAKAEFDEIELKPEE